MFRDMRLTSITILLVFLAEPLLAQGDSYFIRKDLSFFEAVESVAFNFTNRSNKEEQELKFDQLKASVKPNESFAGSPYFQGDWYDGQFNLSGGKVMKGHMALDVNKNVLYVIESSSMKILTLKPHLIEINGHRLERLNHLYKEAGDYYFEPIYSSKKIQIYKRHHKQFTDLKETKLNAYQVNRNIRFDSEYTDDNAFFVASKNKLTYISSRKKFYQIIGKKARNYIEQNNLDLNFEADILDLAYSSEKW